MNFSINIQTNNPVFVKKYLNLFKKSIYIKLNQFFFRSISVNSFLIAIESKKRVKSAPTVLRSPHIFKKAKERFVKEKHSLTFIFYLKKKETTVFTVIARHLCIFIFPRILFANILFKFTCTQHLRLLL